MASNSRKLKPFDDDMYSRVSLIDLAHVGDESRGGAFETAKRL